MRKDDDTLNFLHKFRNRIETIDKTGVLGLMSHTGIPINGTSSNYQNNKIYNPSYLNYDSNSNFQNGSYNNNINIYNSYLNNNNYLDNNLYNSNISNNNNNQTIDSYNMYLSNNNNKNSNNFFKNKGYFLMDYIPSSQKLLKNNPMIPEIKKSSLPNKKQNNFLSKSVNLNISKKFSINSDFQNENNENENIVDHGYTPYSLKDYQNLPKVETLERGLGPNIGSKDWKEREIKRNRMSNYGNNIMKNETGLIYKVYASPEQMEKRKKDLIKLNSKWRRSNTYGKNLLDSRRESINSDNYFSDKIHQKVEEDLFHPERDRETYLKRLDKMKGLFLN